MTLEALFDRHADALYRHALVLVRNGPDAEDVVQNVFAKLAQQLDRRAVGTAIGDFEAYLHTSVRNESRSLLRRRKPRSDQRLDLLVAKNGASPEEVDRVQVALSRLPAEQCEVVMLHVYENLSFKRIGELLEISPDTAASRYRYAREKLREFLRDD